jgi:hypothetical protein
MALNSNLSSIKNILESVNGVENVYDSVRNWQTEQQFRAGARTQAGSIQFWFLTRESSSASDLGPQFTARRHRVAVHGYAGVADAAESEKVFQGLIEAVVEALGDDRTLQGTARHCGPATVRTVDFRVISNVLCHHAEVILDVEDRPA